MKFSDEKVKRYLESLPKAEATHYRYKHSELVTTIFKLEDLTKYKKELEAELEAFFRKVG